MLSRKHAVAFCLVLRAHAVALRRRGARSSSPRHQPVCLGGFSAVLLSSIHETAEGRHRRRRAARERRRLRGSRPAISCPSSRDIAGHGDEKGQLNSKVL